MDIIEKKNKLETMRVQEFMKKNFQQKCLSKYRRSNKKGLFIFMKINIASNEIIHFIGIGGIGMSGLAQIMNNMGFTIQGSDLSRNKNTDRLSKAGVQVYFGHHHRNLKKTTMVVISSAIKKNNKELIAAKHKKLPVFKRGEMLANIVALKKYCDNRLTRKNNYNFSSKYFGRSRIRSHGN